MLTVRKTYMVKSEPEVYKHSNASELHPYSAIAESIKFKVKYQASKYG